MSVKMDKTISYSIHCSYKAGSRKASRKGIILQEGFFTQPWGELMHTLILSSPFTLTKKLWKNAQRN